MSNIDTSPAALRALADEWYLTEESKNRDDRPHRVIAALRAVAAEKEAQQGVVPELCTRGPGWLTEAGRNGYIAGWNECRDLVLTAGPQPPAASPLDAEIVRIAELWYETGSGKSDVAHDLALAILRKKQASSGGPAA